MTLTAVLDSIFNAVQPPATDPIAQTVELYRKDVWIPDRSGGQRETPPEDQRLRLSVLDIAPRKPAGNLLLVHGFAASGAWWLQELTLLSRNWRVIVPDLRGHGKSSRPETGYQVSQLVDDLVHLLDALQITEPIDVGGHSAGGMVAAEMAMRYPERVKRVILIATPFFLRSSALPLSARLFMRSPEMLIRGMQTYVDKLPPGRLGGDLLGFKQTYEDLLRWDGRIVFPAVKQKTLVITGDRDLVFPPEDYKQVVESLADVEWVNLGASKHQIPLERPKAVVRAVERFLDGNPNKTPRWRSENDTVNSVILLAERPWVARYESGAPPTLEPPAVPLTRLLDYARINYPNRPAVDCLWAELTYSQLAQEINQYAALLKWMGAGQGSKILLTLPNLPHFPIAFFASLRLGAVCVLCSPSAPAEEIERRARITGADLMIASLGLHALVRQIRANGVSIRALFTTPDDYPIRQKYDPSREETDIIHSDHWDDRLDHLWRERPLQPLPALDVFEPCPEDFAAIVFPSRQSDPCATGRGVVLSHQNLLAATLQAGSWLSKSVSQKWSLLSAVPFTQISGLTLGMNLGIYLGGRLTTVAGSSPADVLSTARRSKAEVLVGTPEFYRQAILLPGLRASLEGCLCLCSGAPLSVEVKEVFERMSRARLLEGYGVSEACGLTHFNPPNTPRTGSIGLPLPGVEANILDLNTRRPLPLNNVGELALRGPQISRVMIEDGQLRTPDEDGWLRTGDLARMDDDGYFHLFGDRQDAWMLPDGELIFSRDIEEVIYELPEVREAAVVRRDGKTIVFLALNAKEELLESSLLAHCRRCLPATHLPDQVIRVESLPRDEMGRVIKERLTA